MLTIQQPNLNLIMYMDADTLYQMVLTDLLMSWLPEKKLSFVDTEMSEKDPPHLCKDAMLEFMLLKSIQSALSKPVWKDLKSSN